MLWRYACSNSAFRSISPRGGGGGGGGVLFNGCYTNSPLCVPARLSLTAGKYVSRIHAWNNSTRLPSDEYPSIPRLLNGAGYESFLSGKMHYDRRHRYGFKELYAARTNNALHDGKGGRRKPDDESVNEQSWLERANSFHAGDTSPIINHDIEANQHSIEFLKNRRREDKPFFLLTGFLAPHFPLTAPQALYDHYQGRIPLPEIPDGLLASQPLNYQHLRRGFGLVNTDPETVRRGREFYWALVNWFDNQLGELLTALRNSEIGENTVVIYTADHGENRGEHGLWWKNNFYEHGARIPLIINFPKRWKGNERRTEVCSLVDITKTIAEIGGAHTPEDWNGQSLVPILDDRQAKGRNVAVSEYYAHNISSGFTMIREGQLKLIYHTRPAEGYDAQYELYDLDSDPKEFHNLAGEPNYKEHRDRLYKRLVSELGQEPDESEQICRADYARGYEDSNKG